MRTGKIICWDSCVFLSILNGESHPPEVLDGLDEMIREIDEGKCLLITSVITFSEVLEVNMTQAQKDQFQKLFDRRNVRAIDVDMRIARLAGEIRSYYKNLREPVKLLVPDTLHVATAIIYKADVLYTFDGSGRGAKAHDLIKLGKDGKIAGHVISIRMPMGSQLSLRELQDGPDKTQSSAKSTLKALPPGKRLLDTKTPSSQKKKD